MHDVSREQQRLLDGAGDISPDELLGAGVTVAAALGDSATDCCETLALGKLAVGRLGAARFVTIGAIDTGEGCAIGAREGLEKNVAQFA